VNVTVFGTGAMGCWVAARLAASGIPVTVVGTWAEGLEAIRGDGIQVSEAGRRFAARPAVAGLGAPLAPADFVLVLAKAHQTAALAAAAVAAARAEGRIVTLQNGLGNRETLQGADARGRVRAGVVVAGVRMDRPGSVIALPGTVTLEGGDPSMDRLCASMVGAGFDARLAEDIEAELWRKLAVNCAINPISALRNVPNGALLVDPGTRALLAAAAEEVAAVAAARGVAIPDAAATAAAVAARTARNRSSMLQDLDRGARTEIDALCGAVAREARRLGLPAPVNERLWREVNALEAARLSEGARA
jgi:2-dehydropantoate 2-reductase